MVSAAVPQLLRVLSAWLSLAPLGKRKLLDPTGGCNGGSEASPPPSAYVGPLRVNVLPGTPCAERPALPGNGVCLASPGTLVSLQGIALPL